VGKKEKKMPFNFWTSLENPMEKLDIYGPNSGTHSEKDLTHFDLSLVF